MSEVESDPVLPFDGEDLLGTGESGDLLDQLGGLSMLAGPEVGLPVEAALAVRKEIHGLGDWFVHNAGFTADEEYAGVVPALGLAYYYLAPPIETAWYIQRQLAGVLDQLYSWLGGAGKAIDRFENGLKGDISTLSKDVAGALSWATGGWL